MDRLSKNFKGIGVVLMASGFSRRMGKSKMLLPLGRELKPCIRWVAETLMDSGAGEIVAVYQEDGVYQALRDLPLTFIKNLEAEKGQSQSVKLGAAHTWKAEIKGIAFCVGDQPLFRSGDYHRLFKAYLKGGANIILPCVGDETFGPVIFDLTWREELLALEGDRGGKGLLGHPKAIVKKVFYKEKRIFMDVDTPEDYETLKGIMNSFEAWRDRA